MWRSLLAAIIAAAPLAAEAAPGAQSQADSGWGLIVTMQGRSMDLRQRGGGWTDDPQVQPGDIEAGFVRRVGREDAVIGYAQHDYGPNTGYRVPPLERDPNLPPQGSDSGVLGFSLVLHAR
jgi:hypothetical protein